MELKINNFISVFKVYLEKQINKKKFIVNEIYLIGLLKRLSKILYVKIW